MEDLAAALLRLSDAFPDDLGPAADPFEVKDPFWYVVSYSRWAFDLADVFVDRMLSLTPRIMRLLIGGQMVGMEWEIPARFLQADWHEWPPHQRAAVENVLRTWWTATLTEYPSTLPVAEVLAIITQMTGDIQPWLTTWSTIGGVEAAHQLRALTDSHISWSPYIFDFDKDSATDTAKSWMLHDGPGILSALPPGPDLDAALTELEERKTQVWWWL